jgi:hypothetical protein
MINGDQTGHRALSMSESGTVDHLDGAQSLLWRQDDAPAATLTGAAVAGTFDLAGL